MAFEDLHPRAKEYMDSLASRVLAGTHTDQIVRFSGDINDPRARIVQTSAGSEEDNVIFMEGYASGDAFNRLVVKGYLQGSWVSADTWEGKIDETGIAAYQAG